MVYFFLLCFTQDDTRPYLGFRGGSTPPTSAESTETSITPPEAWGGERFDKITNLRPTSDLPSRFGMSTSGSFTSGSMIPGMQDISSTMNQTSMTSLTTNFPNMRARDVSASQETSIGFPEQLSPGPLSPVLGSTKGIVGLTNTEVSGLASLSLARRYSTYAERISTTSAFSDGTSLGVASPKVKKMGSETREDLLNSLSSRSDTLASTEPVFPVVNVRRWKMLFITGLFSVFTGCITCE